MRSREEPGDRRALPASPSNASRRKVMVGGVGMKRFNEAQVHAGRRTNRGHFRRVIRTNFGVRMAKIFRENRDSLVQMRWSGLNPVFQGDQVVVWNLTKTQPLLHIH